jgi:hypothetical protein
MCCGRSRVAALGSWTIVRLLGIDLTVRPATSQLGLRTCWW